MPRKQSKPPADLRSAPKVDAASVRELLKKKVMTSASPLKMPSPIALEALADAIMVLRGEWFIHHDPDDPEERRKSKLKEAYETLGADLPIIRAEVAERIGGIPEVLADMNEPGASGRYREIDIRRLKLVYKLLLYRTRVADTIQTLLDFGKESDEIDAESIELFGPGFGLYKQKDLLPHLAAAFKGAIQSTNRSARLGISAHGPLARFVAATMPLINGETSTVTAVAKQLQRMPGKNGDISAS
jgi:hypothetical protein